MALSTGGKCGKDSSQHKNIGLSYKFVYHRSFFTCYNSFIVIYAALCINTILCKSNKKGKCNMKKLISMSIALAMLLSLAACGSDEGGSTAEADVTTTAAIKAVKDETTTEETTVPEETNTEETTTTEPPLEVVEPAAEDFEYNYDAAIKGVIITQYTGKDKAIRIPTELDGDPVVQFVLNNNVITHVEIPDGFTSIGYRAFSKCPNLKSVTIPDSVTEICEEAFNKCPKA